MEFTTLSLGTTSTLSGTTSAAVNTTELFSSVTPLSTRCIVRVYTSQDVYIDIGANAIATTSSTIMPAGSVEYFDVLPGGRVSVLSVSAAASVKITEMR